jgi:hypothetical protein
VCVFTAAAYVFFTTVEKDPFSMYEKILIFCLALALRPIRKVARTLPLILRVARLSSPIKLLPQVQNSHLILK